MQVKKEIMKNTIVLLLILACVPAQSIFAQNVADSLYKVQQWEKAAAAYEKILQSNPKDRPGYQLNRLGQSYFNLQQYNKAIEAYKKAVLINGNPTVMYNIACAYNKISKKDSALVWLNKSADAGFTQYDGTMQDEDLKSLHADPDFKMITEKIKKNLMPCAYIPEAHQFDFWIGDWKVYNPQGQQAGVSHIEQILGECVIFENWIDYLGGKGKSINTYNTSEKYWQQTWVDDKGAITEFINGSYTNDAMRFADSRAQSLNGKNIQRRLTFFNTNADEVRQLGEKSNDLGKTWQTEYDFKYIRVK
ncbi:MAG: repeat-containing protein [Bacteroidota bacterium]|nr:repeat-containing protein [Bacteroidota bacterium]